DMGLLVLQPGVLDLSLVLGETGADDLFERVEEEATMHAGNDDDFDIRLDDSGQLDLRRAPMGALRAGGRGADESPTGLDHLTLERDVAAAMAGYEAKKTPASGLEHLTLELDASAIREPSTEVDASAVQEPSTPTAPPPAVPEVNPAPAHL